MSLKTQRLEEIKKIILEHKGKNNPVTSNEIKEILGIPDNDTAGSTRAYITKLILDEGMPIGASSTGYFYIETEEELTDYMEYLQDKIEQTTSRKMFVYHNYVTKYGKIKPKTTKLDDF